MSIDNIVGLAAITVACLTFVTTQWGLRRKVNNGEFSRLSEKVKDMERKLHECETARDALFREKVILLERLAERK